MTQPVAEERRHPSHDRRRHAGEPSPSAGEAPPSFWEWVAAAVGLVLLLGSIAFLLHDAWSGDGGPPEPGIRILAIEPQEGRFLVRVRVSNLSRETAAALRVQGELRRGGELVERSEMELDYLPGRSSREGGLFFREDPRALQLMLSARSYQNP